MDISIDSGLTREIKRIAELRGVSVDLLLKDALNLYINLQDMISQHSPRLILEYPATSTKADITNWLIPRAENVIEIKNERSIKKRKDRADSRIY